MHLSMARIALLQKPIRFQALRRPPTGLFTPYFNTSHLEWTKDVNTQQHLSSVICLKPLDLFSARMSTMLKTLQAAIKDKFSRPAQFQAMRRFAPYLELMKVVNTKQHLSAVIRFKPVEWTRQTASGNSKVVGRARKAFHAMSDTMGWFSSSFQFLGCNLRKSAGCMCKIALGHSVTLQEKRLVHQTLLDCLKLIPLLIVANMPLGSLMFSYIVRTNSQILPSTFLRSEDGGPRRSHIR